MIKINPVKPIFTYGLNIDIIKRLNTLSPDEFVSQSSEIIQNAMGIPKRVRPVIQYWDTLPQNSRAGYAFCENEILLSKRAISQDKPTVFASLVHEFTHCFQNMQILRTKKLGNEAITTYSLLTAGKISNSNFNRVALSSRKKLRQEAKNAPHEIILNLINAIIDRKPEKTFNSYQNMFTGLYKESSFFLNTIRSILISEKGIIKDSSEQGIAAKNFFKGFLSSNVMDTDFSKGKYTSALTEQHAHQEQKSAFEIYSNLSTQTAPEVCLKSPAGQSLS